MTPFRHQPSGAHGLSSQLLWSPTAQRRASVQQQHSLSEAFNFIGLCRAQNNLGDLVLQSRNCQLQPPLWNNPWIGAACQFQREVHLYKNILYTDPSMR